MKQPSNPTVTFNQLPPLSKQSSQHKSEEEYKKSPDKIEKVGKQFTKGKIQFASEILKQLNFYLNPNNHKKKQARSNNQGEMKNKQMASNVTRNILDMRNRIQMAQSNKSLQLIPRLKQSRSVKYGTISILQNNEEARNYLSTKQQDFVYSGKGECNARGRDKLRIQVKRWFIENKKDLIQALNEYKDKILGWVEYVQYISRNEFDIIMNAVEIKKDKNLMNRLFWLFDLNGDGSIDFNELQYSINLFKEYKIEDRVNVFVDLCDENDDGYFDSEDLKKFFHRNLNNEEEIRTMKFVLPDFFQELNALSSRGATRKDLLEACQQDINIKAIVEKNTRVLRTLSQEDEESGQYNINNLLFSGQYEGKSGIFFPHIETLMKVVAQRETMIDFHQGLKADSNKQRNKVQIKEYSDDSDDGNL